MAKKKAEKKEKKSSAKKDDKKKDSKFEDLIKQIEELSVVELADLVKELEDRFDIEAAPMAAAPAAGGGEEASEEAEEKSEYTVELKSAGDKKIGVIKAIRTVVDMGLKDAKDLVDNAPKKIQENMPAEDAEKLKKAIEEAGGEVDLK
jgi:large subunit ribosomal protein L7/L12